MSQIVTRKVFLYSSASSEHPIEIADKEDAILQTETFPSSMEVVAAQKPDIANNQAGEIVFQVHSDEDADPANTTRSTTKIMRTYVTNGGEQREFTIEPTPVFTTTINIENNNNNNNNNKETITNTGIHQSSHKDNHDDHKQRTPESDSSHSQTQSSGYFQIANGQSTATATSDHVKESNTDSTKITTTTTKRRSKTSYTYRLKDGIAILEDVRTYQPETHTTRKFTIDKPHHLGENNISFQTNTDKKGIDQNQKYSESYTWEPRLKDAPPTKTMLPQKNSIIPKGNTGRPEASGEPHPGQLGQQSINAKMNSLEQTITQTATSHEKAKKISTDKIQFIQNKTTKTEQSFPLPTSETNTNPSFKYHTEEKQLTSEEMKEKRNLQQMTNKLQADEQHSEQVNSLKKPQTRQNTKEEHHIKRKFILSGTSQPIPKTKPNKYITNSNSQRNHPPARITPAITENRIYSSTTPGKTNKTPVKTELNLKKLTQQNTMPDDKIQFLPTQERQPEKKLNGSTPGRLVIPDFAQHTSTTEVKEHTPSPKLEKRVTEEWVTQIATQEEVRSQPPPLQANKLSADKMQFLHTQDRQPENNLHGSTPGRLVIPDFAQHTSTTEVKEHTPSPKLEKRVTEEWVTQIATQEEVRSEPPPLQANKLSADKMQFLHTQHRQPENNLHGSTPGRLVIPDFAQHTSTTEVKEHTPSPKLEKRVTEEWVR